MTEELQHIKKLVSNSRAIITNQIALPLGISKMSKILYWLRNSSFTSTLDLTVFEECYNEIKEFPLGSDRLLWAKEALILRDEEVERILLKYRNEIITKCHQIIKELT